MITEKYDLYKFLNGGFSVRDCRKHGKFIFYPVSTKMKIMKGSKLVHSRVLELKNLTKDSEQTSSDELGVVFRLILFQLEMLPPCIYNFLANLRTFSVLHLSFKPSLILTPFSVGSFAIILVVVVSRKPLSRPIFILLSQLALQASCHAFFFHRTSSSNFVERNYFRFCLSQNILAFLSSFTF